MTHDLQTMQRYGTPNQNDWRALSYSADPVLCWGIRLANAGRQALRLSGLVFLLTLCHLTGFAASLTATLDRDTAPVGESVTLSLTFEGMSPGGQPGLPQIPGIQVAPGTSERSEISIVQGQQSIRKIFDFSLILTQTGNITIPAMQVKVGNQVLTTQPLVIKAVAATAGADPSLQATNQAFVRLLVPRKEVFLGEPFSVEIQLYWQNARDIQRPQLQASGFSLSQPADPAQGQTQVGGRIFNTAVFRMSATAATTGKLTLGPAESSLTVLLPLQNKRRTRDAFGDPFGFFGPQTQPFPMVVKSEALTIDVLPLPSTNVPPGFTGAIGVYTMNVTAVPTNVAVGDPITLKIQISGKGPVESIGLPEQANWNEFKVYPPTGKTELSDPMGLAGTKTFEQVVVAQNTEVRELPPFVFSFFNPQQKRYVTLNGPVIPLIVRPSAAAAMPTVSITTNANTPPPATDILHIKPHLGMISATGAPLIQRGEFWLFLAPPIACWIALTVRRRMVESLANNPRLRRRKETDRLIQKGMIELSQMASGNKTDDFYVTLFRLVQERLGERLDLPASAITEAVIDEHLRPLGAREETLASLQELFQICNQARYAGQKTKQELNDIVAKVESVLKSLEEVNS